MISAVIVMCLFLTPPAKRFVFNCICRYLSSAAGINVEASSVSLNYFRGSASLENLTIRSTSASVLPPVFQSSHAVLDLDVSKALRGKIILEEITLVRPEIYFFRDNDGNSNLPVFSSSGTGGAPEILIARAGIQDGVFQYDDLSKNLNIKIPGWSIDVKGNARTLLHHIAFENHADTDLRSGDTVIPIKTSSVAGILNLEKNDFEISSARVESNGISAVITGNLNFSEPSMDVTVNVEVDLRQASVLASMKEPLSGNLSGEVHASGDFSGLDISTQLGISNFSFYSYNQKAAELALRGRWQGNSGRLIFPEIIVSSPEGIITGNADLAVSGAPGTNTVAARIKNLDPRPLMKLSVTPPDIAGRVDGTMDLKWEGDFRPEKVAAGARLTFNADKAESGAGVLPLSGNLNAELKNNRLEITVPELKALDVETTGRLTLENFQDIEGEFNGTSPDIGPAILKIARFLDWEELPSAVCDLSGSANFHIHASGTVDMPEISASLETPELNFRKFKSGSRSDFLLSGRTLEFNSDFKLPQNAAAGFSGRLNFSEKDPVVSVKARIEKIPAAVINDIVDINTPKIPLSGVIDASADIAGTVQNPEGNALVSISDLSLYENPLGQLDAELFLLNREVVLEKFLLRRDPENSEISEDSLAARVFYALDSGQFGLRADGRDITLSGWNLPEGVPSPEKINIRVSGEGTVDRPSVKAHIGADDLKIKLNGEEASLGAVSITADIVSDGAIITATAPKLNLSAEARGSFYAPYHFTGELRAKNSDLSVIGLKPRAGQPLSGYMDAVVRAAGNLEEPENVEIDADIENLTLRAQDREARLFSPARLRYRGGVLEIPNPALLVTRNSQLELSGRVPIGEAVSEETLKLRGRVDIAEVLSFTLMPEGFESNGVLILDVGVKVLDGVFGGEGEIAVERGFVKIPGAPLPFDNINMKAAVEDGALILREATAKWGIGGIAVSGELPFRALPWAVPGLVSRDGPVQFKLAATGLTPEMTGLFPSGLTGKVSLHANGSAAKAALESLHAEIIFDELSFKIDALDFYQTAPARIEINDGTASISRLTIAGPETNINLGGSAGLLSMGAPLNLWLNGFLPAAILTFGDPVLQADGRLDMQVIARGTLSRPMLFGYSETDNGRFALRDPRIVADNLRVRIAVTPENIRIERLTGLLNGGDLTGKGSIEYRRGLFNAINLSMSFSRCFLEAPKGLRSASSGTITIISKENAIEIGGIVRIDESDFRESIEIGGQVMNYLKSQQLLVPDTSHDSVLNRIHYNISVRTITPLLVQNNLARAEAEASGLRVVGTYYEPSVIGNITLAEGGEIILNQQVYYLDHGVITFANQTRVEPELDIQAHTEVAGYEITFRLTGVPDRLEPFFSSEPALPEQDILYLLLTGMTSSETLGREMQVMQTQALSLLAGQAGEQLTGEARRALGISTFRIDPGFITSESDPGARLTIGEDIKRDLSLAYSMNLTNGSDQIWAARYAMPRRLTTQATRQMDNSYRFEFRHDLRFGDVNAARSGRRWPRDEEDGARTYAGTRGNTKFEIGGIRFTGEENFSEDTLLDRLSAKPGSRYDFSKIQKGIDRLNEFYIRENYFEKDIRVRRETDDDTVNLEFAISPGPVVRFYFDGFRVSSDTHRDVERAWTEGAFEAGRIDDAVYVLRRDMIKSGYFEAKISVETEILAKGGLPAGIRNVVFHIVPGTLYSGVPVRFSGAAGIDDDELRDVVKRAGLEIDVYDDPGKVIDYIQRYYYDRGYLEARAATRLNLNPETRSGEVVIEIHEGPLFTIGDLEFTGNSAFDYNRLWMVIPTSSGSSYNPETLRASVRAIESLYHSRGYNDVSVTYRAVQDTPNALAHLTFQITERRQSFIEDIRIEGNLRSSQDFVTRQLDFQAGDTLDFEKINESRRRLYATGIYSSIDFRDEEIAENGTDPVRKNMRIRIRLRENAPYRLQYGLYYDTDRGPGGIVEAQNMNFMSRASNLGLRLRYDTDLSEARVYYNQPFVRLLHLKMDFSAFWQRDKRPSRIAAGPDGCDTALYECANERIGFSLTQERALPKDYRLDYGYRYEWVKLVRRVRDETDIAYNPQDEDVNSGNPVKFQAYEPVAQLMVTLTRDTRDSILDATSGEFAAHTVGFGPTWLGSQTGFARYSGQYFRYISLDKYLKLSSERNGRAVPARFVYAFALRLGLTSSFGSRTVSDEGLNDGEIRQRPLSPERFFAGGGTTMRGFEQDSLGPVMRDASTGKLLYSAGGEGMFILNNEIRFPLWNMLQGVVFLDIGNIYERISDFDFSMRKSAGAGLRLKIKSIPLRFDYGFKLDKRRPGERGSAFFFSIGQAF